MSPNTPVLSLQRQKRVGVLTSSQPSVQVGCSRLGSYTTQHSKTNSVYIATFMRNILSIPIYLKGGSWVCDGRIETFPKVTDHGHTKYNSETELQTESRPLDESLSK